MIKNDTQRMEPANSQEELSLSAQELPSVTESRQSSMRDVVYRQAMRVGSALTGLAIFLGGIDKTEAATVRVSGTAGIFDVFDEVEPGESPLQSGDEIDFEFEIDTDALPNTSVAPGFYDSAIQFDDISIYKPEFEESTFTSFDYNYVEVVDKQAPQGPQPELGDSIFISGEVSEALSDSIFLTLDLGFNFPNPPTGDDTLSSVDLMRALFAVKSGSFNNQSVSFFSNSSNYSGFGDIFFIDITTDVEGDFNLDGVVDAADYTVWRDTFGSTTNLAADANGDGLVASFDYDIWAANYGDSQFFFSRVESSAVPEPGTIYLALAPAAAQLLRRRRD